MIIIFLWLLNRAHSNLEVNKETNKIKKIVSYELE